MLVNRLRIRRRSSATSLHSTAHAGCPMRSGQARPLRVNRHVYGVHSHLNEATYPLADRILADGLAERFYNVV